jgi:hypothetical protein
MGTDPDPGGPKTSGLDPIHSLGGTLRASSLKLPTKQASFIGKRIFFLSPPQSKVMFYYHSFVF